MRSSLLRRRIFCSAAVFILLFSFPGMVKAQNVLEDALEQLDSEKVKGYIQPFVDSFGANINSGFPGSAKISKAGLTFRFQIVAMGTMIGDAEKTYSVVPPEPFPADPVETATIFGEEGTIVSYRGVSYQFQNGQIKTDFVPFAVPQITFGDIFGTQATIRYVPIPSIGDFPKTTLFGIGLRHSISQYLPLVPVDLAAGIFYQTFTVGDIIDTKATAFTAQVSKDFAILTLYGGLQFESASMNVSYYYEGPLPPGDQSDRNISVDLKGENTFRARLGAGLNLGVLHLNADLNIGKVTVISAGIGFGV